MCHQKNYTDDSDNVSTQTVTLNYQQSAIANYLLKPRVLLVEDIPLVQKIHSKLLRKLGCVIDIACDGRTALTLCRKNHDVIFMDITLPDITGIELCHMLRGKGETVPIIALTAENVAIKKHCITAGMNDFLQKPATIEVLQRILQRWLSRS